jgi:hypothetical protein
MTPRTHTRTHTQTDKLKPTKKHRDLIDQLDTKNRSPSDQYPIHKFPKIQEGQVAK